VYVCGCAWAKAPAQHGEGSEVQFGVAVRIGVMLFNLQIAFVVQEAIKHKCEFRKF